MCEGAVMELQLLVTVGPNSYIPFLPTPPHPISSPAKSSSPAQPSPAQPSPAHLSPSQPQGG